MNRFLLEAFRDALALAFLVAIVALGAVAMGA